MIDCVTITTWQELPYKCHEYTGHKSYESAAAEHERLHGYSPDKVYEYNDPVFNKLRHFVAVNGATQDLWSADV